MKPFIRIAVLALIALAWVQTPRAESSFPDRPIRILLPSSTGGGGDMVGRLLADGLAKRLAQPLVVENNAGASGTIAIGQLAYSKPDGYTIGLGTMTSTTLAPAVYPKLPYDPNKDLVPVGGIGTSPIMMVATADFPANDLKQFLDYAKRQPYPIQYATWGLGSTGHFCAEVLTQKTGVPLTHIPYKGTGPIVVALLANEVKVAWVDMATGTTAVKTGKVKPLAMCTRRTANFPDVASYKEQGVDFDQWTGWALFAPAGVPKPVLDKLSQALRDTLDDPSVASKLLEWGITAQFVPSDEQLANNRRDVEIWKRIAHDAGMKLDY